MPQWRDVLGYEGARVQRVPGDRCRLDEIARHEYEKIMLTKADQ